MPRRVEYNQNDDIYLQEDKLCSLKETYSLKHIKVLRFKHPIVSYVLTFQIFLVDEFLTTYTFRPSNNKFESNKENTSLYLPEIKALRKMQTFWVLLTTVRETLYVEGG